MLHRLNTDTFATLEAQWAVQCQGYGEDYSSYATPHMDLARKICGEDPPDVGYGVFSIKNGDEFLSIVHVNAAFLPGIDGRTLRVLWLLLSPKHDYEDVTPQALANVTAALLVGAHSLAVGPMQASQIKVHMGNTVDRQFFTGVAIALGTTGVFSDPTIRGNWLHLGIPT